MRPELRGDRGRISTCPLVGLLLLSQLRLPLPLAQTSMVGLLGSAGSGTSYPGGPAPGTSPLPGQPPWEGLVQSHDLALTTRQQAWHRTQVLSGRHRSWPWAWEMLYLDTPGNKLTTPAVTLLLPEACPGACSQPSHSGIWTPLYNLPKGRCKSISPPGAVEGRGFSRVGALGIREQAAILSLT